jgi:peptide/nickel transport system permease protein
MLMGQRSDLQSLKAIRTELGLDQSFSTRYFKYIDDLSPISIHSKHPESYFYYNKETYRESTVIYNSENKVLVLKKPYLQRSFQSKKEVMLILSEPFFNTFLLALISIVFASILGIILGVFSALYKNTFYDKFILVMTSFGMSLPSFFAAILVGWLFAFKLSDYTHLNLTGNLYELDDYGEHLTLQWKNLILPALTLGIRPLSVVLQLSRNSMLDVLSQDYIRTAKAKGLSPFRVISKHALKNSLNPVITSISGWLASMMAGVVFVEFIFGWKGLGFVIVEAVNNYDIPVVMGVVLLISIIFVFITLFVDLIYLLLDPRVKY